MKKVIARYGYPQQVIESILGVVNDLEIKVLPEPQNYEELVNLLLSTRYLQAMLLQP